ncbi:hypothetical protein FRC09_011100, partial [Ceratobasidium sp. 395]
VILRNAWDFPGICRNSQESSKILQNLFPVHVRGVLSGTAFHTRSFMESHLMIEMSQLLTLMESAALGGAQSEAAAATASDGSPPMATNPNAIPFVEYKNYHKTVKQDEDCGFKRLTETEWNEWKERKVGQQPVESGGSNDQNQQTSQTSIALENEIEPQVAPGAAGAPTVEYSNAVCAPSPSALFKPRFQATQPSHPFDSPISDTFLAPGPATWPVSMHRLDCRGVSVVWRSPSLRFQDAETPETLARQTTSPRRLRSCTPANPPEPHQQPVRTLRNRTITRSMSSAVATNAVQAPLTVSQLEGFYSEFAPPGV